MPIDVVVGLQRGDEGKGKFVDLLAPEYDIVARFNGGDNAGHTIVLPDDSDLKVKLLPSGIDHDGTTSVIGGGTLVNPVVLAQELADAKDRGIDLTPANLKVSQQAHLITPLHIFLDKLREESPSA